MISKEIKIENRKDNNLMSAVASKCDKKTVTVIGESGALVTQVLK